MWAMEGFKDLTRVICCHEFLVNGALVKWESLSFILIQIFIFQLLFIFFDILINPLIIGDFL